MNRGLPVLCTVLLWVGGSLGGRLWSPEVLSSSFGSTPPRQEALGKQLHVPEPVPQPHNRGNSAYTPGLL